MRATTRLIAIGVGSVVLAGSAVLATADVSAAPSDVQAPLVEDYAYPGADQVLARRGIKIFSGDGHILLVACGQPELIEVRSGEAPHDTDPDPGHFCFKANAPTGFLTLNIPNAFQVLGDSHAVTATVTVNEQTSVVPIVKHVWTGIGLGSGPDPATLLRIDAKP